MRKEKSEYYIRQIIKVLMNKDVISTSEIADDLELSVKSTRNKINLTNDFLMENNFGTIEKRPRLGVWLKVNDINRNALVGFLNGQSETKVTNNTHDRMTAVLRMLFRLMPRQSIMTQEMADELFVSPPTVLKVLKDCKDWLSNYHIRLINERNHGYSLQYKESDYRIALKDFICNFNHENIHEQLRYFFWSVDVHLINKAIVETENEWNYMFTDDSFYEILIYCCLAIQRRNYSLSMHFDTEDIDTLQHYNEYDFTVAIFRHIQKKTQITLEKKEIYYLTMQIMCSRFMEVGRPQEMWDLIKQYDEKLIRFIDEMIETIGNVLSKDLSKDNRLRESLVFHLRATIFRLRYGRVHENSMLSFIKSEYKNVFRATWSISILFEKYYGVQITEGELAYIVLYIESALERKEKNYKAVLISNLTRGYVALAEERIQKNIPEITYLVTVGRHDFNMTDYKGYDLIVSDQELNIQDHRFVVISNLLSDDGILTLRNFMNELHLPLNGDNDPFSPICYPLFSPDLLFLNLDASTKEEAIQVMSHQLENKGYVTTEFYRSVIDRENVTSTAIGNKVALPHGAQKAVNASHVSIATLRHPIPWDDDEEVDIVFLLAFKLTTHEEIERVQTFYKEYISLIETDDRIQKIRRAESNLELFRYLIR